MSLSTNMRREKVEGPSVTYKDGGGGSRFYTRLRLRQTSRDLGFRRLERLEITLAIVTRVSDNEGWSSHTNSLRATWEHCHHEDNT